MGGFLPVPGQSIYGASKAAVKLFTEGLYSELKNTNVHVTVVFPGAVDTDIVKNSGLGDSINLEEASKNSSIKMITPEKAAQIIIAGMQQNQFRVLAGPDSKFMDFLYRLNPKFATNFIYKQMKSLLN